MTNFAFLMDLLNISSKKFLEIGFDRTLVSRWRRGKLRLMPGRHIVRKITELFWGVDLEREHPVLEEVLTIWYPVEPCHTKAEKQALLERFLTEKGQLDEAYASRRENRLGKITEEKESKHCSALKGVEAAKLRLLDFLDLIITLPAPVHIMAAYPQGRGALSADAGFNAQVLAKFDTIFEKGHTMESVIRSDGDISNFAYSYNSTLAHILKGHVRNRYFNDFSADEAELFLAVAENLAAFEIREEEPGRVESSTSAIYADQKNMGRIRDQIRLYHERSTAREELGFFDQPDGYLKYVHISPDSPCYLISRLPHFSILPAEKFADSFSLTEAEARFVQQELKPLLYHPDYFWENAPVRHIFCESAVENALRKQRHQSSELSKLLKRRVWMTTTHLVQNLLELKRLLNTHSNYEVCFLSEEQFEALKIQLAVWGYGASVVWLDEEHAAASRGYVNQRIIQGFCHVVWDKLPGKLKSRAGAIKKIEQWLNRMQRQE